VAIRRVCVFCGSSPGHDPRFVESARAVGRILAENGMELVYGGGRVGLMGAVAEAALAAGGRVIGIIPEALARREVAFQGLTELVVVGSMHERKQKMADRSDAFVALPGGFGTFEEFCEIVTWSQLGMHAKPCVLVDVHHYYQPMVAMIDRAHEAGFVRTEHRDIVSTIASPDELIAALRDYRAPVLEPWLTGAQT